MEFLINYADLVVQAEPMQAIAVAPLIIGALSAGANLYSSWKAGENSANANATAMSQIEAQQNANENWYNQRMNENNLDSAEGQAAITKAREMAQEQMAYARGKQAVMGGTDASIAAAQQSANKMIADTMSGVAAAGTARKDAAEQMYLAQNSALAKQITDIYTNKANQNAAAGSSALSALGQIGSSLITAFGGSGK